MKIYTRLLFKKEDENTLVSKSSLLGERDLYYVRIRTNEKLYTIETSSNGEPITLLKYEDLNKAKKEIKEQLKTLGVKFYDEVRKKS